MTDKTAEAIRALLEAELLRTLTGGSAIEQRMTALRVRGTSFEVVTLNDDGLVIEPVRCTCRGFMVDCPLHKGGIT